MGEPDNVLEIRWMQVGALAGLAVCVIYPVLIIFQPANVVGAVLISLFGPLLSVASFGLRAMMNVHRGTVPAHAAAILNTVAGAFFSGMLLIQLAEPMYTGAERAQADIVSIWLAMDVAWDVYLGLGTLLFAIGMFRHPRFRWPFAVSGLVIAALLLALNLYTFPMPPANAGLFDIGPVVGVWYLGVSVQMLLSVPWARRTIQGRNAAV